jgi:16S rRNA (cytosine1402-N4)-methyltransferase
MTNLNSMHVSVMHREVMDFLNPTLGGCFLDGTLGLGGHSVSIAERIGSSGHLIGLDRDEQSMALARERLKGFQGRLDILQSDFRDFDVVLKNIGVQAVDGILLDLGISSFQMDDPKRGFSFRLEGPLDMRMDQGGFMSAAELVNSLSEEELAKIIFNFGEERYSRRIARTIVQYRAAKPLETTQELEDLIFRSVPAAYRHQRIHPATRTFQALRIAVNRELESLKIALDKCVDYLKIGGRIAVISFHSLEDRIVKEKFRNFSKEEKLSLVFKKPIGPSDEEVQANPRSRSAKLRVAERITCS